ncbi:hypothetical protein FEM48_Zijuj06G0092400 [Ziziphus jujuba var. spinosa]|uniref:Protein NRT1/ PTR FAMILY 1.2-like n=1 Tax=Ziziphus jujuba var. spinosa TaxID=714518 RepID=A0A978V8F1_ZIZJJ|nr:hypothetical protein FEM48_Zijuj06G0092400 [Ziziphus jujuba var. spinosa]
MGLGIFMSIIFMSLSAIVESVRRKMAIRQGFSDDPEAVVNMSAMWVLPQNILTGFGESTNAVAQMEFYYSELPKTMSSISSALLVLGMSVGNLAASFIMSMVDDITKNGNGDSRAYGPCKEEVNMDLGGDGGFVEAMCTWFLLVEAIRNEIGGRVA